MLDPHYFRHDGSAQWADDFSLSKKELAAILDYENVGFLVQNDCLFIYWEQNFNLKPGVTLFQIQKDCLNPLSDCKPTFYFFGHILLGIIEDFGTSWNEFVVQKIFL